VCDVDRDKARIEVRQQLTVVRPPLAPDGGLMFSERSKADRGRRRIDLGPTTVAALRKQQRRQKEQRILLEAGWSNEHDLVFTEPDGRPLDPESAPALASEDRCRGLPGPPGQGQQERHRDVALRGRLCHIGVGRPCARWRVLLLVAGKEIQILDTDGSTIRRLTLNPKVDYQPMP
jgi:hypothetical protein